VLAINRLLQVQHERQWTGFVRARAGVEAAAALEVPLQQHQPQSAAAAVAAAASAVASAPPPPPPLPPYASEARAPAPPALAPTPSPRWVLPPRPMSPRYMSDRPMSPRPALDLHEHRLVRSESEQLFRAQVLAINRLLHVQHERQWTGFVRARAGDEAAAALEVQGFFNAPRPKKVASRAGTTPTKRCRPAARPLSHLELNQISDRAARLDGERSEPSQ
jgi:hypothetical protein